MNRIGFFDVDCREDALNGLLAFRPRVQPIAAPLERLYAYAEQQRIVTVFTTCCSGRMLERGSRDDIVFVPLDAEETDWIEPAQHASLIYLQKKAYGDPKMNYTCRAFDVFTDNLNAFRLLQVLGVEEWVVFGNGFDFCVNHVAGSILRAGYAVTMLTDLMIRGAKGYGNSGTEENMQAIYAELTQLGARLTDSETFLEEHSLKSSCAAPQMEQVP